MRIVPADEVNRPPIARTDIARTRSGVPVIVAGRRQRLRPRRRHHRRREHPHAADRRDGAVSRGRRRRLHAERHVRRHRPLHVLARRRRRRDRRRRGARSASCRLLGANRAPEAFDDDVASRRRQRAARVRRPRQRLRPRRRHAPRDRPSARRRAARPRSPTTAAPSCSRRRPQLADADGASTSPSPTPIDDGRGGTASATVTVHVIGGIAAAGPDRRRRHGRAAQRRASRSTSTCSRNDLDPDGDPAELAVSSTDPALVVQQRRHVHRHRRDDVEPPRVHGHRSGRAHRHRRGRRAGRAQPGPRRRAVHRPDDRRPTARARPRRRRPPTPTATPSTSPAATSPRAARRRRVANGAGQLRVTFTPDDGFAGPATFAYTVDDQQGHTVAGAVAIDVLAAVEPAAGGHRHHARRRGRHPDEHRPGRAGDRSRRRRPADVRDQRAGRGRRDADASPAPTCRHRRRSTPPIAPTRSRTRPPTRPGQTRRRHGVADGPSAGRPAAAGPRRRGDDEPGPGRSRSAVLANDIDPLGSRADGDVRRRLAGRLGDDRRPAGDVHAERRLLRRRRRSATASRDGANTAERAVRGAGRRSPSSASRRRRARRWPREGNATATINWAAPPSNGAPIDDYELRVDGGESRSIGTATAYTWSGLTNGTPVSFSVRAHNSAGWGPWSGSSPAVTPDIAPGRPAVAERAVRRRRAGRVVVAAGQRGQRDHQLRRADRRRGVGDPAHRHRSRSSAGRACTNGQEYTFQVRAVNAKGEGEFSSPSAPEHPLRQPDAPAAAGRRSAATRRSPSAGARPATAATRSSSTRCRSSRPGATNTTTGTSIRWANLPNGQPQQFQVRARNRGRLGRRVGGVGAPSSRAACPTRPAAWRRRAATARRRCRGRPRTTRAARSPATR